MVALTIGTAPFGEQRAGAFDFDPRVPPRMLYFEPSPRWVRVEFAGQTVADSRRVKLLHETELLPVYYFPEDDVRADLLEPTDHRTRCPVKGEASYWSIVVGDRVAHNAVWGYRAPLDSAPWLAGHLAFYWNRVDRWFEEDEEVFVHPRDPYHRVDVLPSSRHVQVVVEGESVADSRRPLVLFETGLPPRYYLPREDVRAESLAASDSHTRCPYKGVASYWSVKVPQGTERDLVWEYPDPLPEVARIADHLAFYNERVDLVVDGEPQERPVTRFS